MKLKTACVLAIVACVLNISLCLSNFFTFRNFMAESGSSIGFDVYIGHILGITSHTLFCIFFITLYNNLKSSK